MPIIKKGTRLNFSLISDMKVYYSSEGKIPTIMKKPGKEPNLSYMQEMFPFTCQTVTPSTFRHTPKALRRPTQEVDS
jgi:hypothetical protein